MKQHGGKLEPISDVGFVAARALTHASPLTQFLRVIRKKHHALLQAGAGPVCVTPGNLRCKHPNQRSSSKRWC